MSDLNMDFLQDDTEFLEEITESSEETQEEKEAREAKEANDKKTSDKSDDDSDGGKSNEDSKETNDKKTTDDNTDNSTNDSSDNKSDDDSSKTPSNKFSLFASTLKDEGVLDFNEKEDKVESAEDLAKLIQDQIKKSEFSDLTNDQKEYLDYLENGFNTDEYKENKKKFIEIENLKEENLEEKEDLQKDLIIRNYIENGMNEEKAKKIADRSFDLNSNLEDSKEALAEIEEREKKRVEQEKKKRESDIKKTQEKNKQNLENLKKRVYDEENEILPGVKYNKNIADKVYKNLTEPVEYDENNRPISAIAKARKEEGELEFERKLNSLFVITDGFKDFSTFSNTKKTNKVKEFEKSLQDSSTKTSGKGHSSSNSNSDFDSTLEELENYINQ